MTIEYLQDYDLNAVFKIKLRLNNGEIKYHVFDSSVISDGALDSIFQNIDDELEKIYGQ